ncbi:hypothetical protein D9M70_612700 [compost metagenome]
MWPPLKSMSDWPALERDTSICQPGAGSTRAWATDTVSPAGSGRLPGVWLFQKVRPPTYAAMARRIASAPGQVRYGMRRDG